MTGPNLLRCPYEVAGDIMFAMQVTQIVGSVDVSQLDHGQHGVCLLTLGTATEVSPLEVVVFADDSGDQLPQLVRRGVHHH